MFSEVYSLGGPPQNDRELWMASTLTYGFGTRASHASAVNLYGWLRFPLRGLHVTTLKKRRSRDGIIAHHRAEATPMRFIDFIPVTGPEQTVLDAATLPISDKAYRRIVRQAQVDDTSYARLLAFAARSRGARGIARLRAELAQGPSPTRSANEDEILEVFRAGGDPLVNHLIAGDEVDLYFPTLRIVVEVMSVLHDNPTARADDDAKKARLEARGLRVLWIT